MTQQANSNRFHLGFLSVTHTDQGYVGGMLVTNHFGRPLEFQCTTPVRPNRTQQILYGPTLEPFVCAELIGKTLFDRLSIKPLLIIVEQESLLELRRQVEVPLACLLDPKAAGQDLPEHARAEFGGQSFRLHPEFPEDQESIAALKKHVSAEADMKEPLERVNDALKETLRAGAVA